MEEVPVLKELNDIREYTGHDLSVLDEAQFNDVAHTLTQGRYTPEQVRDAYLQLHLIADNGGSIAPQFIATPVVTQKNTKNTGKYDLTRVPIDKTSDKSARDNKRSREMSALAQLLDFELSPTRTNPQFLNDTQAALQRFISTNTIGSTVLGNSGYRTQKKQGDPVLLESATQNWNDISGGYDRLSGDYIGDQQVEFGHYVPAEEGGADDPSNGRMQAKRANRAMGKHLGVTGALRVLGPSYSNLNKRFAGDRVFQELYTGESLLEAA